MGISYESLPDKSNPWIFSPPAFDDYDDDDDYGRKSYHHSSPSAVFPRVSGRPCSDGVKPTSAMNESLPGAFDWWWP